MIETSETSQAIRDLFLGLLLKSVSNLIYGPQPLAPWTDGLFGRGARPGRDRKSPAHSMVGVLRLQNVLELTQRAIDEGIPGDLIETGVWRGGCCILMRGVLAANLVTNRKVYVADSFAGLPPPNTGKFPLDKGLKLHKMPCRDAVDDYRRKMDIVDKIEEIDWTGAWWQKSC